MNYTVRHHSTVLPCSYTAPYYNCVYVAFGAPIQRPAGRLLLRLLLGRDRLGLSLCWGLTQSCPKRPCPQSFRKSLVKGYTVKSLRKGFLLILIYSLNHIGIPIVESHIIFLKSYRDSKCGLKYIPEFRALACTLGVVPLGVGEAFKEPVWGDAGPYEDHIRGYDLRGTSPNPMTVFFF